MCIAFVLLFSYACLGFYCDLLLHPIVGTELAIFSENCLNILLAKKLRYRNKDLRKLLEEGVPEPHYPPQDTRQKGSV